MTINEDLYTYLTSFGFTKEEITKVVETLVNQNSLQETILKHAKENNAYLESLGIERPTIIKMIVFSPNIYGLTVMNLQDKIKTLQELGYTLENCLTIITSYSETLCLAKQSLINKVDTLVELNYSRKDALKMLLGNANIFNYSPEMLKSRQKETRLF